LIRSFSHFSNDDDSTTTTTTTESESESSSNEKDKGHVGTDLNAKNAAPMTNAAIDNVFRSPFALNLNLANNSMPPGSIIARAIKPTPTLPSNYNFANKKNSLFAFTDSTTTTSTTSSGSSTSDSTGGSGSGEDSSDGTTTSSKASRSNDPSTSSTSAKEPISIPTLGLNIPLNRGGAQATNAANNTVNTTTAIAMPVSVGPTTAFVLPPILGLGGVFAKPLQQQQQSSNFTPSNPNATTQSTYKPKTATKGSLFAFSSSESSSDSSSGDTETESATDSNGSSTSSSHSRSRSNSEEKARAGMREKAVDDIVSQILLPEAPLVPPTIVATTTTTTTELPMPIPMTIQPFKLGLAFAKPNNSTTATISENAVIPQQQHHAAIQSNPLPTLPSEATPPPLLSPKSQSLPQPLSPHGSLTTLPRIGSIRRSQTNILRDNSNSSSGSSVGPPTTPSHLSQSSSASQANNNNNNNNNNSTTVIGSERHFATNPNPSSLSNSDKLQPRSTPFGQAGNQAVTMPKIPLGLNVKLALNQSAPSLPTLLLNSNNNRSNNNSSSSNNNNTASQSTPMPQSQSQLTIPFNLALGGGQQQHQPPSTNTAVAIKKPQPRKNSLFYSSSSSSSSDDISSADSDTSSGSSTSDDSGAKSGETDDKVNDEFFFLAFIFSFFFHFFFFCYVYFLYSGIYLLDSNDSQESDTDLCAKEKLFVCLFLLFR
jgi:hypothetical protein